MNPQQYPPQPGQPGQTPSGPGYPGPGGQPPQGPYPNNQPGQWQPGPGGQPAQPPQYAQPQQPQTNGYNPYAYLNEYALPPSKPKGPNKAVILIGFIVLMLVISVVVLIATSGSKDGATPNDTPDQNTGQNQGDTGTDADVVDRSDSTLDLAAKINSNETLKAQTLKGKTKQQVNLSSGFSFMVTKTEAYTSTDPAVQPAAGKKFIAITAIVGNRNESTNISVSYLDFRLRDANNQLLAGNAATNQILNNPLASPSEIKPGAQLTGKVIYEVDANDTSWVFKHSETYQKTTDDTTFTVEGEIVAQLATATTPPASTAL